jgi:hypothetical protein
MILHNISFNTLARISQSGGSCHFISPRKAHTLLRRFADMSVFTESVPNLKQRINQLQTRHTAQLENLYAHQATQYLDEALDQYMAQSDEANGGGYSEDIDVRFFSRFFRQFI